jgi:hypothetical protein
MTIGRPAPSHQIFAILGETITLLAALGLEREEDYSKLLVLIDLLLMLYTECIKRYQWTSHLQRALVNTATSWRLPRELYLWIWILTNKNQRIHVQCWELGGLEGYSNWIKSNRNESFVRGSRILQSVIHKVCRASVLEYVDNPGSSRK